MGTVLFFPASGTPTCGTAMPTAPPKPRPASRSMAMEGPRVVILPVVRIERHIQGKTPANILSPHFSPPGHAGGSAGQPDREPPVPA
ncbi:hypothetical protein ACT6QH_10885 [Xanthobacter sp. TB0139]|uniref:hypothetical protein n=1 Tax=Xanthobacter sp. TB0139 TaxID=3459178 RepID=UPI00403949A4